MLRLFLLVAMAVLTVTWVDPGWNPEQKTLSLRLRGPKEVVNLLRQQAVKLGERALQAAKEDGEPPAVGSAPPRKGRKDATQEKAKPKPNPKKRALPPVSSGPPRSSRDNLRPDEREALNRLIEEKAHDAKGAD